MRIANLFFCFLLLQISISSDDSIFKSRISFLNIGLDCTKYSSADEIYRSIFVIPIMLERKNFEIGIYINPFIKEKYDSFGNYKYDKLLNSYILNFRLRYIKKIKNNINAFIDLAYCDERFYASKHLYWVELGFMHRFSQLIKVSGGYKKALYTNNDFIDIDSFFINFIIGHSFLKRK